MLALTLRPVGVLLVLGAACAAAVNPASSERSKSTVANMTARLEALVRDMADGQQSGGAPAPEKLYEEDVMILEEGSENRRRLGACNCNGGYRNGATRTSGVCAKVENGRNVCYPQMSDGSCSVTTAVRCGARGGSTPTASPTPLLSDEEAEPGQAYLNVDLQLFNPHISGPSQLPSPNQFRSALAALAEVSENRVNVITTWGAPTGVRSGAAQQQGDEAAASTVTSATRTTATVHATFSVRNEQRRETLSTLLSLSEELPEIGGESYTIINHQVFEQASRPLICDAAGEQEKSDAAGLLRQLVELKRQEVELLRQSVTQAAGQTACNQPLLQRIATRLGIVH